MPDDFITAGPRMSEEGIEASRQRALKLFGVDIGILHTPELFDGNAGYFNRKSAVEFSRNLDRDKLVDPAFKLKIKNAIGRHGLIVIGKGYKRRGVVEHEIGHGISTYKGTPFERWTHKPGVIGASGLYSTIPSTIAGSVLGYKYGIPAGVLGGAALGVLTNFPELYSEHSANRYARKLMTDAMNKRVSYFRTLGGYVVGSALTPAISGGLGGGLEKIKEKRLVERLKKQWMKEQAGNVATES